MSATDPAERIRRALEARAMIRALRPDRPLAFQWPRRPMSTTATTPVLDNETPTN